MNHDAVPAQVYLLERDGKLLARMPLLQAGEGLDCTFEPTAAFEPHRALFAEHARLAEDFSQDAPPELIERFDWLEGQIRGLNLTVRAQDGSRVYRQPVLLVMDDRAHVLPLDEL